MTYKITELVRHVKYYSGDYYSGDTIWDSAVLAAARACGCDAVYSEDMSSEQDYDDLRVINPFASSMEAEVKAAQ